MLASRGYKCAYKGKWHLSDEATAAEAEGPLTDALGGAYEGHHRDGSIARDAIGWLATKGGSRKCIGQPRVTSYGSFASYYLDCLREVDEAVMALINGLEQAGLTNDTVIVFTSDPGELAGAHGLFGKCPCAYDENIRIPLIIVDPDRPGGRRTRSIGSQVDIVPTVLRLALPSVPGAPLAPDLPGADLSHALDGDEAALFVYESLCFVDGDWARRTFVGFGADDFVTGRDLTTRGFIRTIITDRHKLSPYFAPGEHHRPRSVEELVGRNTLELFDLEADPNETLNLAEHLTEDTTQLCEALDLRLSSLIAAELGDDDGHWLPKLAGAPWMV